MKRLNISGRQFGKWEVLCYAGINHAGRTMWMCKCSCGLVKNLTGTSLVLGKSKACHSCSNTKHGLKKHPLYFVWQNMKDRCYNKNNRQYCYWGGRGISVCKEWMHFPNFYSWAINNGYKKGKQLDRINSNNNYTPDNCQFLTASEHGCKGSILRQRNVNGQFI